MTPTQAAAPILPSAFFHNDQLDAPPLFAEPDLAAVLGVPLALDSAGADFLAEQLRGLRLRARIPSAIFGMGRDEERKRVPGRISIRGLVLPAADPGMSFWGITHTGLDQLASELAEDLADESVREIVLEVDSPGGVAQGVSAVAQAIRAARGVKPVYAYVGGRCCSAAMWLASQATALYAGADSLVGSLGVMRVLRDSSGAAEQSGIKVHLLRSGPLKGAGTPGVPISEAEVDAAQAVVDGLGAMFARDLRAGRPALDVAAAFTGQVWLAGDAPAGLVDPPSSSNSLPAGGTTQAQQASEDSMTVNTPPAPAAPPAREPATLAQLKALGGPASFVLEQLEARATLEQAQLALAQQQAAEAQAQLKAEREAAQAKIAKLEAERDSAQRSARRPGADPARSDAGQGGNSQVPDRFLGMSWKEAIRAYRDETQPKLVGEPHKGIRAAAEKLDARHPGLRDRLMDAWERPTKGPWSHRRRETA